MRAVAATREWALSGGLRAVTLGALARAGSLPKFRCSEVPMSRAMGTHIGISTPRAIRWGALGPPASRMPA